MKHATVDIEASSPLLPDFDARAATDDVLTRALTDALRRVADGPVSPVPNLDRFQAMLDDFDFAEPRPLADLLPWVIGALEGGMVHPTHPRYFGLFNPAPAFAAECAERIVAAFNPQLASATTSPIPVALEAHVTRAIVQRAGLPAGSKGHFTSGGSEANHTALVCALTRGAPEFATLGARGFSGPPLVYVSEDAHLAWYKIAHETGIGRSALRLIPTDCAGRLDTGALSAQIAADRTAGGVPVMVVATAGTTGAGIIDPITTCGRIARAVGAWFHVDAAWGGALLAVERLRGVLAGIETADSVTIDAHKWFAATMGCGMFLTAHPAILSDAFFADTVYMPSKARHADPYLNTMQWSRRFMGLRLFLALASVGWDGYAAHVERALALAAHLRQALTARGWRVVNDSPVGVLCVDPPDGLPDAREIARRVVASQSAWISATSFRGRDVLRMCITNGRTTLGDIATLVNALQELRQPVGVSV
jgi:glutamate/tyrosine decarboxylase-like PLP-dependent enzyme